jgi:hypothetical protein
MGLHHQLTHSGTCRNGAISHPPQVAHNAPTSIKQPKETTIMSKTNNNKKQNATTSSAMVIESLEGREMFAVNAFVPPPPQTTSVLIGMLLPAVKTAAVCPSDPSSPTLATNVFKAEPPPSP